MTTAQFPETDPAPAAAPSTVPPRRTGTRLWVLVLIILIGAAIYFFAIYERAPRVVLITSGDGAYWDPVIAGAEEAARQFDVKLAVDRIKSDPYVQAETIKQRVAEKPDGIAISPLNASIQANLLADVAASTTLVTLDSDSPVTGRLLFVGTDNYAAGREAGENVRQALPDGGEVIISLGNPDKENTLHRRQGVIDELLERPFAPNRSTDPLDQPVKGERYTVVATLVDESNPARATELATEALKRHPNVKCFVGLLAYSAPAVLEALESAGKLGQVKVVAFDVEPRTKEGLAAGHVYATILQDQYGCGFHAVRVLADQARGVKGGMPLFQMHALPHRAIRKDNLADLGKKFGADAPADSGRHPAPAEEGTNRETPAPAPTTAPAS